MNCSKQVGVDIANSNPCYAMPVDEAENLPISRDRHERQHTQ